MRIISGTYRSRILKAPPGLATRPTSDRLRETLFNVLATRIAGAAFLDLYAGSGAVGLEALSRGAASVDFVERSPAALKVLRENLAALGMRSGFHVHAGSVAAYLRSSAKAGPKSTPHAVVFLDPPYDAVEEYETALGLLGAGVEALFGPGGVVVAEHRRKQRLEDRYGGLSRARLLEQGDAALSFYGARDSLPRESLH
jgi:16S rRNA (guanine966-N2)-methyltransferase